MKYFEPIRSLKKNLILIYCVITKLILVLYLKLHKQIMASPTELAQDAHKEQVNSEFPGCSIEAIDEIARLRQEIAEKDRDITTLFHLSTDAEDGGIMFCRKWCRKKIKEKFPKKIIDWGWDVKPVDEDARCRAEYELSKALEHIERGGILH